jgi:hypothetical protein
MTIDFRQVARAGQRRHGVVTREELLLFGASSYWISQQVAEGRLIHADRAVYVIAGTPDTWEQRLAVLAMAAGPGALVSGPSSLALWVDELSPPRGLEVSVPWGRRFRRPGVIARQRRDLALARPTTRRGIPTTGLPRALLDVAGRKTPDELELLVDAARRQHSLSIGSLVEVLHLHAAPGRDGITTMRTFLQQVNRAEPVPDSDFERFVLRDLKRMGVERPALHHLVRFPGDPFELDLAWVDQLVNLELDGGDHLHRMSRILEDRRRDRILRGAGWFVDRMTWDEYVARGPAILTAIARRVPAAA